MTPFGTILLLVACAALMLSCVASAAALPSDRLLAARDVQKQMISGDSGDVVECEAVDKYATEASLGFLPFLHPSLPRRRRGDILIALFCPLLLAGYPTPNPTKLTLTSHSDDAWPCPLYDQRPSPQNPLRCIHHSPDQRRTFFENMSRAFALRATEGATVLHDVGNYYAQPRDGLWASVERGELVRVGGAVHWLRKVAEGVAGGWEGGLLECVEWKHWSRAAALSEAPWPEKLPSRLMSRDVDDGGDHDGREMERRAVID
ncbi:hypothetical protein DL768_004903 [Monosporascus sp. mg162]|nr:hypothetical protein DL768_004903 [Monosporascus sp. mg162]